MMDHVALSSLVTLTSGGTPSKANSAFWGGAIPWLTPKDMNAFDGSTTDCVTSLALGNGTRLANADTIFIAVRGMSLHKEIRIVRARRAMAFNQDIKGMQPSGIDRDFLYFALQYRVPQLLESVEAAGHGTGVLPTERLSALQIPRFDASEEQALGQFFAALDDKIELNRRMNETLEGIAQAIFRDWFVDFGPTRRKLAGLTDPALIMGGLIASAVHSAALAALFPATLGDNGLPEGWCAGTLADVCELKRGYDLASQNRVFGTTPIISSSGPTGWHDKPMVKGPGIVTGRYGTVGQVFTCHHDFWPLNTTLYVRDFKGSPFWFVFYVLRALDFTKYTDKAAVPGVNRNDLHRDPVNVPNSNVASIFHDIVDFLMAKSRASEAETATLAATRDLLLPKLMSGEIRLAAAEALVGAVT
jgi:type I restriction enzyme, S subunit